jgi:hypothetical protein
VKELTLFVCRPKETPRLPLYRCGICNKKVRGIDAYREHECRGKNKKGDE